MVLINWLGNKPLNEQHLTICRKLSDSFHILRLAMFSKTMVTHKINKPFQTVESKRTKMASRYDRVLPLSHSCKLYLHQ